MDEVVFDPALWTVIARALTPADNICEDAVACEVATLTEALSQVELCFANGAIAATIYPPQDEDNELFQVPEGYELETEWLGGEE